MGPAGDSMSIVIIGTLSTEPPVVPAPQKDNNILIVVHGFHQTDKINFIIPRETAGVLAFYPVDL